MRAAVLAVAVVLTAAAPAAAQTTYWGTGPVQGVTTVYSGGAGKAFTTTASGQLLAQAGGLATIAYECATAGTGASTNVITCSVQAGNTVIVPGPLMAGVVTTPLPPPYRVCMSAQAVFIDASTTGSATCTRDIWPLSPR